MASPGPLVRSLSVAELLALLAAPDVTEELSLAHGCAAVVVTGDDWPHEQLTPAQRHALAWLPCVTVAPTAAPCWRHFDVVDVVDVNDDGAAAGGSALLEAIVAHPQASVALVRLLRAAQRSDPHTGLWVESVTYGLLQAGTEFAAWRGGQVPPRDGAGVPGQVRVARRGDDVTVVLDRPERRNALDVTLRDALVEALRSVAVDPAVGAVTLRGAGPSFCSGGDLSEFGTFPDPVAAHLIRSTRLPARAVLAVRGRLAVNVHGASVGAGVELAAFAPTVVADPRATFRLPEVGMGLVPGSGGTWSITHRIGAPRTAWLALTGTEIDAATAQEWGLVDRIEPVAPG